MGAQGPQLKHLEDDGWFCRVCTLFVPTILLGFQTLLVGKNKMPTLRYYQLNDFPAWLWFFEQQSTRIESER